MKLRSYFVAGLIVLGIVVLGRSPSFANETIDGKVEALLQKMTLEEKVGQMTQITLQAVSAQQGTVNQPHKLDENKLYDAIVNHHVGSIFNVYDVAHTLDYWHEVIEKIQRLAVEKTRLGIPVIYGIDAIHGANYTREATLFPQSIAMAATWNPELVRKEGEITALEVRASGIPWNFNPVLGVGRHPAWPRFWETYGEDPYLVSVLGSAYIKGLEGENNDIAHPEKVASCMKHYLGYSFPLSGKDRTPAWIPERMLREIFLPPFRAAVEAGTHTVMLNSSEVNGIPVHCDSYLLTDVLKKELGFKGFVVTDWHDIINLWEREKVAATRQEAVKMAVMAGVDMSMVPYDFSFYYDLLELVRNGEVPLTRIDDAVRRILKVKFELGLFDNPFPRKELKNRVGTEEAWEISLQAAREAITLLKNENHVLPLKKSSRVLVTGPTAHSRSALNGGWTYTWQGNEEALYPTDKPTILEALQAKLGKENVEYVPGADFESLSDVESARQMARQVDAVILCLGEPAYCETPGNISDLTLPEAQLQLARVVAESQVPVILVLVEGRPRIIHPIIEDVDAVVMAYLPGPQGSTALAEILLGEVNPSGKLPFTYPRFPNSLTCYDHKYSEEVAQKGYEPEFPFGHGLSYTKFTYRNLKLNTTQMTPEDSLVVEVEVENSGQQAGKEVVLLFVSDVVRSITPPVKQLKRFTSLWLEPGEKKTVQFTLSADDLKFIGRENKPVLEPGEFIVSIDSLQQKFVLVGEAFGMELSK